ANGAWLPAEPEDGCQGVVYRAGDRIAFEIKSNHTAPIYFYVLDLGLAGAVSLLYPPQVGNEQLAPRNSICIGIKIGEEIELFVPDNYPFVLEDGVRPAVEGTEIFKLFATTQEADLWPLFQAGFRGRARPESGSRLDELLELALRGQGQRDGRPVHAPAVEEWTTVERVFTLRR
ncbi:MAG: hypothetical protein ACREDR_16635, partial [Blastocatellia bacterium]